MTERPPVRPAPSTLVNPATIIFVCALTLMILGLAILFSASASMQTDAYYYLNKQFFGVALAGTLCFVISRVDLSYLRNYAPWIGGVSLVLLALVVIPHVGISVNGSRRWLGVGRLRFQVSEFAKLGLVFCLAHYLAQNQTRIGELRRGFLWPLAM